MADKALIPLDTPTIQFMLGNVELKNLDDETLQSVYNDVCHMIKKYIEPEMNSRPEWADSDESNP